MAQASDNGRDNRATDGPRLPPKPEPEPCCGSGCDPCVLEIYEEALERWEQRVAQIMAQYEASRAGD